VKRAFRSLLLVPIALTAALVLVMVYHAGSDSAAEAATAKPRPPEVAQASDQEHRGHGRSHKDLESEKALALHDGMRKLWEDHITWTRLFIVSAVANLPDLDATTTRLLQNQTDIGNAIKPFYGEQAGNQLTALLRDHILIAAELVNAAKAGDQAALADANARWYANANDIAAFLNRANPRNWPLGEMQQMMKQHLDLTLQEAVAQLQGDFAGSVAAYDAVHAQILQMADMLSGGIIAQFRDTFDD
jgi:hypothetical protein